MKHFAGLSLGLLATVLASAIATPAISDGVTPKAIVELFTSQGCSSCVPADAYFADLAKRKDVVALSLHVDYWDYLGWRDTLSDPANTERQRHYAAARGSSRVYTPQMVINGSADFVGSDRGDVDAAIERSSLPVPVSMRKGDGTVEIEVGGLETPHLLPSTIRL